MTKDPLVSVVVPVYNVEKYLDKCIESIINQSYRNIEVILINDGSLDNSLEICYKWRQIDPRILVFSKKNEGLGMARNTGITLSKGEYICFFDSDDFIDEFLLEKCVNKIMIDKSDLVVFGVKRVTEEETFIKNFIPNPPKELYKDEEIKDKYIKHFLCARKYKKENWNLNYSACCCMYSMKTIQKLNFRFVSEREIISEDTYSLFYYISNINRISIIKEALYNYRHNPNSLTHQFREDRIDKNNLFYNKMNELCEKMNYNNETRKLTAYSYYGNIIGALKLLLKSAIDTKEKKQKIKHLFYNETFCKAIKDIRLRDQNIKTILVIILFRIKSVHLSYFFIKMQCKKGA